jgi:hypothetical protein
MRMLRKLGAAVVMMFVLAFTAFAGEPPTPPCAPGQIDTPPCAAVSGDMEVPTVTSTTLGDIGTPAVASETSLTGMAADVLLIFLPLF